MNAVGREEVKGVVELDVTFFLDLFFFLQSTSPFGYQSEAYELPNEGELGVAL